MRNEQAVSSMLCPVCRIGLSMADRQGIEIDFCPQCRGVWLDRGELDKIIERSGAAETAPQPQDRLEQRAMPQVFGQADERQYGHDPWRKQKRRKSFLEELFD